MSVYITYIVVRYVIFYMALNLFLGISMRLMVAILFRTGWVIPFEEIRLSRLWEKANIHMCYALIH